jgi:hypothetical protein
VEELIASLSSVGGDGREAEAGAGGATQPSPYADEIAKLYIRSASNTEAAEGGEVHTPTHATLSVSRP